MNIKTLLTVILLFAFISLHGQNNHDDTLKPLWIYYIPSVVFDEDVYANGSNWTSDGIYLLPCELIDFKAYSDNNECVFQWASMSETNASHFNLIIILPDGSELKSEAITAGGNSNQILYYTYKSMESYPLGTIVQLTQTDFDGKTHFMASSSIINNNLSENTIQDFSIIKTQSNITAIWYSKENIASTINIYSFDGNLIAKWKGTSVNGINHSCTFSIEKGKTCIIVIETAYDRQVLKTIL